MTIPAARLELPWAEYRLELGDEANAAHLLNEPRAAWQPRWRPGFGPLQIAAAVPIVGRKGAQLVGDHARRQVVVGDRQRRDVGVDVVGDPVYKTPAHGPVVDRGPALHPD